MRNLIIDIKRENNGTPSYPVSSAEVKTHLNITTTDYDTEIADLIKRCTRYIENHCSVSLVQTTVIMIADLFDEIELPYGPIGGITNIKSRGHIEGSGVPTYSTVEIGWSVDGDEFKTLCVGFPQRFKVTYTAGYTTVPDDLKEAVLNEVAYRFKNKGDNSGEIKSEAAINLAAPYVRYIWI